MMSSLHNDEDSCADDTMFEEFSRSNIVPMHASLLFDYDCYYEDVFSSSSSEY